MRVKFGPGGSDLRCMLGLSTGYLFTSKLKNSLFGTICKTIYICFMRYKNNFYLLNKIFYCLFYRLLMIRKNSILHFFRGGFWKIFIWYSSGQRNLLMLCMEVGKPNAWGLFFFYILNLMASSHILLAYSLDIPSNY